MDGDVVEKPRHDRLATRCFVAARRLAMQCALKLESRPGFPGISLKSSGSFRFFSVRLKEKLQSSVSGSQRIASRKV
jgi:hypothetical protein